MSSAPAIAVASAPMRISLAGGGTDLPSYAEYRGGTVVSLAIDRRVAVAVGPGVRENPFGRLGQGERISHRELMQAGFAPAAIRRVGAGEPRCACVSAAPPRSGLGGSGSFLVACVHALRAGDPPAPVALAEEASAIEMEDLGRSVGKQDHYLAALGGLQVLHIDPRGAVAVETIGAGEAFEAFVAERLLLFHTGIRRDAAAVLAGQHRRTRRADRPTLAALDAIHSLVEPMLDAIRSERFEEVGPLLSRHWRHKEKFGDAVAIERAARLHQLGLGAGAEGGKLLGAGGGGFMLFSCRPERHPSLRAAMRSAGAEELPFAFSAAGSSLWCDGRRAASTASVAAPSGAVR